MLPKGIHDGRVTYPDYEAPLRDESFRLQSNAEHYTGLSPFCALPDDMVQFFPNDYMHPVCLGVMKRLLFCWTARAKKFKLSAGQKVAVNTKLELFRRTVPCEFSRKSRTLVELAHWKATEFRYFCYTLVISCFTG
jgi:hypothetical protein